MYFSKFLHLGTFDTDNFCIDFAKDYCDSEKVPSLRAIINDEHLIQDKMTTVFGSNVHNRPGMILFKQIGYSFTIFSLLLTVALHAVMKEIRKVHQNVTVEFFVDFHWELFLGYWWQNGNWHMLFYAWYLRLPLYQHIR